MQQEQNQQDEEQKIQEDYQTWKKNAPFIYDVVITDKLDWISMTVQWLPTIEQGQDSEVHKLILGTITQEEDDSNYLQIAKVRLPSQNDEEGKSSELHDYNIKVETKILHEGEINKARYMPQKSNIIATKTASGEVHIFDYNLHSSKPTSNQSQPQLRLTGHDQEGYGLSWNNNKEGHLISAGYDNRICYWDIQQAGNQNSNLKPFRSINFHKSNVEDVCWHVQQPELFGSVSDDKLLAIWDCRTDLNRQKPVQFTQAHDDNVNTLDFSPFSEFLCLTGSDDKTIALYDLRNLNKRLHSFENHTDSVLNVQWSPFNMSLFSSSSSDRRVVLWDVSRCGSEIKNEDEQDGPAEMLFVHAGHKAKVNDISWNQNYDWMLASVDENNIIQVWKIASKVMYEEDEGLQIMKNVK